MTRDQARAAIIDALCRGNSRAAPWSHKDAVKLVKRLGYG